MSKLYSRRLLIVVGLVLVAAVSEFLGLPLSEPTLDLFKALGLAGLAAFGSEDLAKSWQAGKSLGQAAVSLKVAALAADDALPTEAAP